MNIGSNKQDGLLETVNAEVNSNQTEWREFRQVALYHMCTVVLSPLGLLMTS